MLGHGLMVSGMFQQIPPPANINETRSQMCDAYKGETSCTEKRYVLCVQDSGNLQRPPYEVTTTANAMSKEAYSGWVPTKFKPSNQLIEGIALTSQAAGDSFCGAGWKMAEFHDGYWIAGMNTTNHHGASWNLANAKPGGWNFHARLEGGQNEINKIKRERYWVASNTTQANCWNP